MFNRFNRLSIGGKVMTLALVAVLQTLVVSSLLLANFQEQRMNDRIYAMRVLAEAAHGVLTDFYNKVQDGEMTREEALEAAHEILVQMRFNDGDYVYVYGYDGEVYSHVSGAVMEMNILDLEEPGTGRLFIQDFTELVQSEGEGATFYNWFRADDRETILEKAAYLIDFAPWEMYVGSGLYVDDLADEFLYDLLVALGISLAGAALMAGLGLMISQRIGTGVRGITESMTELTRGNVDIEVPGRDSGDEIGRLAEAAEVFRQQLKRSRELEAEREAAAAHTVQLDRVTGLITDMRQSMGVAFDEVTNMIEQLQGTADSLAGGAQKTAQQTAQAAENSQLVDQAVQTVALASEEMSSSARSVAQQMNQAREVSAKASTEAAQVRSVIKELNESSSRITDVVQLIDTIAAQTNLLALNATIEAARAGDAGKGFAVVASEVKHLAKQTAESTEQIRHQVQSMMDFLSQSVSAVESIGKTIDDVNELAGAVSDAMDQQTLATDEIGKGASQAAGGTSTMHENIASVREESKVNAGHADALRGLADGLSERSRHLQTAFDEFLNKVQAA